MPRGNVRDFMGHHAGQLRLFIGVQNQSAVHIEKAARQGKRVDFVRINHFDGERHFGVGIPHQILADAIHVFRDHRVGDHLGGPFHFLRGALSECDFALQGIEVYALSHTPVPDGINVFLRTGFDALRRLILVRRRRLRPVLRLWLLGLIRRGGRLRLWRLRLLGRIRRGGLGVLRLRLCLPGPGQCRRNRY